MEIDELKLAWQALGQQLERENKISMATLRHQNLEGARRKLRPLFAGQILQIFFGVAFILIAGLLWSSKPSAVSVIVAGVLVQAYGIGCVISAGIVLGAIRRTDYAGSVLEIQSKLGHVRRAYAISVIVGGLTWWYLWIPLLMALAGLAHANLYANAPSVIWTGVAIGTAGLAGMGWIYSYSRKRPGTRLRRLVDESLFSRSFQAAQAQLDEIRRFEEEC